MAGALGGACVAVLIALPVAWMTMGDQSAGDAPANIAAPTEIAGHRAPAPAGGAPAVYADAGGPAESQAVPRQQPPPAAEARPAPPAAAPARVAPPSAAPARVAAPVQEPRELALAGADEMDSSSIVVSGSRIARPDLVSSSPVAIVDAGEAPAARAPAAGSARGDWNACTIDDPARNLAACRAVAGPAAASLRGRAAAHIADGLAQAWRGEHAGAISAFDRAIAIDRRSAAAHLNRGLAWRSRGDLARALADLDRAIRHDPSAARGYYHRSLLLRQRGDIPRARADEHRAIRLDPRYAALLRPDAILTAP